jgi:Zn-dependent alcohol dehydrogenase
MSFTKKQIIAAIEAMPKEEFDVEELIGEIILLEKIEEGLKAVEKGDVISEEEANKIMDSWLH